MKIQYFIIFFLSLAGTTNAYTQSDSIVEYEQLHMFRIKQENDLYQYWYQSDKDFTDGLHFELAHRIFDNKPADFFLLGFKDTPYQDFSLSLGQDIYTPANTKITELDTTDRPYSALLYFTYTKFSNQFFKGKQLVSNFYLGVSGRRAFGKEVQNGVHGAIGNTPAEGWDNQLKTGLMLDYDVTYDQLLPIGASFFETSFFGKAHIGTIYDYVTAGITLKIGRYTDSYINEDGIYNPRNKTYVSETNFHQLSKSKLRLIPKSVRQKSITEQVTYLNNRLNRKLQFFVYFKLQSSYTFYDGTVEGSLIQFSPNDYILKTSHTDQFVIQGEYGINFQYSRFYLNFNRFIQNNPTESGEFFGFGEIAISYIF